MNFDPLGLNSEHTPRSELLLDIKEDALELISALRIQRDSDIERSLLYIDMTKTDVIAPDFMRRNIASDSSIKELLIDTTVNRLTGEAELSLVIDVEGAENIVINVITEAHENGEPLCTIVVNETEMPCIEPATKVEVNRFLASLFTSNKLSDFSAFDSMDLSKAHTAERLVDALREVANDIILDETYFLADTLSATTDSIRYTEADGEIKNVVVSIEHHAKASAIEISYGRKDEQADAREFDELTNVIEDPEFMMQNLEGARTYTQNVSGESTQVESSREFLIVARDFVNRQKTLVFSPEAESLGDSDIDVADPTFSMNIEDKHEN
jgi:hypothetical protein